MKKRLSCLLYLLCPLLSMAQQPLTPITPAPVVSPPPPVATPRIPASDGPDVFPRWHPYVQVGVGAMDLSTDNNIGFAIDRDNITHVLIGGEKQLYYYHTEYERRNANGFSRSDTLIVDIKNDHSIKGFDLVCGPDKDVHVVWSEYSEATQSSDLYYLRRDSTGWSHPAKKLTDASPAVWAPCMVIKDTCKINNDCPPPDFFTYIQDDCCLIDTIINNVPIYIDICPPPSPPLYRCPCGCVDYNADVPQIERIFSEGYLDPELAVDSNGVVHVVARYQVNTILS
ncbi:MAG: hypothetical protein L6Q97_19225, partial [Thermoanaerobaculia bacterium]|nr:hypothetical protein [Thermoanaerobaculia bacterium]